MWCIESEHSNRVVFADKVAGFAGDAYYRPRWISPDGNNAIYSSPLYHEWGTSGTD